MGDAGLREQRFSDATLRRSRELMYIQSGDASQQCYIVSLKPAKRLDLKSAHHTQAQNGNCRGDGYVNLLGCGGLLTIYAYIKL